MPRDLPRVGYEIPLIRYRGYMQYRGLEQDIFLVAQDMRKFVEQAIRVD
jgi:hypothetical protein